MGLFKSSIISGLGVVVRLLAQLGLNKVLAVYLGPAGFALVGQYQSILQILSVFSTNTLGSGIVKTTAESDKEGSLQQATIDVWRASVAYSLASMVIVVLLAFFYGDSISKAFLGSAEFSKVPLFFAASFIFFCLNNILISILNGFGKVTLIMFSNISGSIIALLLVYVLVTKWSLFGALVALSIYQGVWFFVTICLCIRQKWCEFKNFFGNTSIKALKFLGGFMLMSLITAICVPIAQLYLRNLFINEFSAEAAGYWEAMQKLSIAYLSLITTVLAIYFLPKYAKISNSKELKFELKNGYSLVVPSLIVILVIVYFLRDYIVNIVYSTEFSRVGDLLLYQLIGDFFKICSWLLSYYLVAKAQIKAFISLEVFFTIFYVVLTEFFVKLLGFEYVALGYMLNYIFYFTLLFLLFSKKGGYFNKLDRGVYE